jgi:hypothetical protein
MWTAKVQGPPRPQDTVELSDHVAVADQMFQNFKADDFIECSIFVAQIVKIASFKSQARGV